MAQPGKIVVPDGMLRTARNVCAQGWKRASDGQWDHDECAKNMLGAALRYLSDNPILPLEREYNDLLDKFFADCLQSGEKPYMVYWRFVGMLNEWQRQMFLAPEPPERTDDISDMILKYPKAAYECIIEAYRRGLSYRDRHPS